MVSRKAGSTAVLWKPSISHRSTTCCSFPLAYHAAGRQFGVRGRLDDGDSALPCLLHRPPLTRAAVPLEDANLLMFLFETPHLSIDSTIRLAQYYQADWCTGHVARG